MAAPAVYVGDIGTAIYLDTLLSATDAATVTLAAIDVKKPDGTTARWVGSMVGSEVMYATQAGDLDQAGTYRLQAYVEMPAWRGHGSTFVLEVLPTFR